MQSFLIGVEGNFYFNVTEVRKEIDGFQICGAHVDGTDNFHGLIRCFQFAKYLLEQSHPFELQKRNEPPDFI